MNKVNVAIVGCGSIGALKEDRYDSPSTRAILTHAHAFRTIPEVDRLVFVDSDRVKSKSAANKWGSLYEYGSLDEVAGSVFLDNFPEIVVVASPTETHERVCLDALKHGAKLIVAEKPFCSDIQQASWVAQYCEKAGVPLVVNYTRRYDDTMLGIFKDLRDGIHGRIYHARCLYGRGLRRDGCHGVDIFNYIFSRVTGVEFDHASFIHDGPDDDDPSITMRLRYERCPEVYMVAVNSRHYGLFELEFITEKGIINLFNWGKVIMKYHPETETTFGQYKSMSRFNAHCTASDIEGALKTLAEEAVGYFKTDDKAAYKFRCTAEDALRVHRILECTRRK